MEDHGAVKRVDWQAATDEEVNHVVSVITGRKRNWAASDLAALSLLQALEGKADITVRVFKTGGVSIIVDRQYEIFGETLSGAVARVYCLVHKREIAVPERPPYPGVIVMSEGS